MQETRSIRCRMSEEDNEVRLWQCFGWTLLSSQEVNVVDNSLESDYSGNVYQIKHKEQYVKLVFARETNMKNYSELVSLERQYDSMKEIPYKMYFFSFIKFLFFTVIYLIIFIIKKIRIKKANEQIKQENQVILEKKNEILEKARRLLN